MTQGSDLQSIFPEFLERNSFPELAGVVRSCAKEIEAAWQSMVRSTLVKAQELTFRELQDHFPQAIARLADSLEFVNHEKTQDFIADSKEHGLTRFKQGYNIEELVVEYRLLRRVMVSVIERKLQRDLNRAEDSAVHISIDTMLQQGIATFFDNQKQKLQAATQLEAKYLSFLSHDLRNSLNRMSAVMFGLKRKLKKLPEFEQDCEDISSVQRGLLETVEGVQRMLQAEKMRSGGAEPKLENFDLLGLAVDLSKEFATEARIKGISLQNEIPEGFIVYSDKGWLRLALQNLLGNAVKFTIKGSVTLSASLEKDYTCTICISDQGPGIAAEHQEKIFESFNQGHTDNHSGVGLGLAIASRAATLLGASLTVQSELGVGSTFRLTLPPSRG